MTFVKGQSGNPDGRPLGARNRKTLLADGSVEMVQNLIGKALAGEPAALRLCLDRLLPRGADRPVQFPLPQIECVGDIRRAVADIVRAVGSGDLTPREGRELLGVVTKAGTALAGAD